MATQLLNRLPSDLPNRQIMANGLTLVNREDFSADLLSLQLWVKSGSIHEGHFLGSGLSHYLEHLVFKATDTFAAGEIACEVQAAGGSINAYTTFDRTVYYIDLPADGLERGLKILEEMAFRAKLLTQDIESERAVILREIDMGMDDPDRRVSQALFSTAFRRHPYRHPIIGQRSLFESVAPDDLRKYYQRRYVTNNMGLVVVGAVETETLVPVVEKVFGAWGPRCLDDAPLATEPPQLSRRVCTFEGEVHVCRGGLAYHIPSLTHPDAPAIDMLAALLGGGRSARLWKQLREEQQLVHYIDASAWNPGSSGLLWISYVADKGHQEAVEDAVSEVIQNALENGFGERELDKAKCQALSREINSRQTMAGQAARMGRAEMVIGDLDYIRQVFRRLEALTPEDVARVGTQYLREEQLTTVALNPKDAKKPIRQRPAEARSDAARFECRELSNGARILFQRDTRLPKINLRFSALGGPVYEEPENFGVTGLLATLLTRDTEKRTAEEVSEAVESAGGSFCEFAGNNSFGLSLDVMKGDEALALDLLEQALLAPKFDEGTVQRERDAQVSLIQEEDDEIVEFGQKALRRHFFGSHPLACDPMGKVETVAALSALQVRDAYRQMIVSRNAVFSVCGDFEPDEILPQLEVIANALPDWMFVRRNPKRVPVGKRDLIIEQLPREQAVLFLGFPDVGVCDPAFVMGEILNEIVSDMSGELFMRVRENQGLAYFVGASRVVGVDEGLFFFYGGTHPDTAAKLLEELEAEAKRISGNGLTDAERDRAVSHLKSRKSMRLQGIGARAAQASINALYDRPINDWLDYNARVDAVTTAQLRKFAKKQFTSRDCVRLRVSQE